MTQLQAPPEINIAEITVKPGRGRKHFDRDKLFNLSQSIAKFGLAHPVVVTNEKIGEEEKIVLVAGERRYRACLMLGWMKIPYRWLKDFSPEDQKRLELYENKDRDDLHWSEENALILQIKEFEKSVQGPEFRLESLAEPLKMDRTTISVRANFAQECQDRPDIAAKIKEMPMTAAISTMRRMKEAEKAEKQAVAQKLVLNTNFKMGDCTELIKEVPDNSVDMIASDMPFAIPDLADADSEAQVYKSLLKPTDNLTTSEMISIINKLAPQWWRVMKPSSYGYVFFGWDTYGSLTTTLRLQGFDVDVEPIIWFKNQTTSPWRGYSPAPCYEQILQFIKPPRSKRQAEPWKRVLDGTRDQDFQVVKKDLRTHPFEKPVSLWSRIIKNVTHTGEVVMDNFAGTGSSILAAMELKRNIIAHEIDQNHYYIAQSRMAELSIRLNGGK